MGQSVSAIAPNPSRRWIGALDGTIAPWETHPAVCVVAFSPQPTTNLEIYPMIENPNLQK